MDGLLDYLGSVARDRGEGQGPPVQKGEGAAGAGDRGTGSLPVLSLDERGSDRPHVQKSRLPLVTATTAARRGPSRATLGVTFRLRCASALFPRSSRDKPRRCGCAPGPWTGCLRAGTGRSARAAPALRATPCPEFAEGLVIVAQAAFVVIDACPERSDRNTLAVWSCSIHVTAT